MSSGGWGFAYGAGTALYDVADTRIKDKMEQRREGRAHEASRELEQFKAGIRAKETAGKREYEAGQSKIAREHETEEARLEREQEMKVERFKATTGTAIKPLAVSPGEAVFSGGKFLQNPYGAERQANIQERVDQFEKTYLDTGFFAGLLRGEAEEKALLEKAARAAGLPPGDYTKEEILFQYSESLQTRGGQQPQPGPAAQPGTTFTGQQPQKGSYTKPEEDESTKPKTAKERNAYAVASKDPNSLYKFFVGKGEDPGEAKDAVQKRYPGHRWKDEKFTEPPGKQQPKTSKSRRKLAIDALLGSDEEIRKEAAKWANSITLESAKKRYEKTSDYVKDIRKYQIYITPAQKNKAYAILRQMSK